MDMNILSNAITCLVFAQIECVGSVSIINLNDLIELLVYSENRNNGQYGEDFFMSIFI